MSWLERYLMNMKFEHEVPAVVVERMSEIAQVSVCDVARAQRNIRMKREHIETDPFALTELPGVHNTPHNCGIQVTIPNLDEIESEVVPNPIFNPRRAPWFRSKRKRQ